MSIHTPSTAPAGEKGGPPSEPPYPWQLFVGMLLAILVGAAILALALGLNPLTFQRLGPAAERTPTTPLQSSVSSTAVPTAAPSGPTAVPTVAPIAQPVSRATPNSAAGVSAQPAPTQEATTPTAVHEDTASTASAAGAVADSTPAIPPGVDATLANAVVDAYIRYWDARAHATGDPFAQGLDEEMAGVMAGVELAKARQSVADFRADGRVYLVHVDHEIQLQRASSQEALIVDQFTSTARKIDPDTRVPTDSPPLVEHRTDAFLLRPIDGAWKVVDEPET